MRLLNATGALPAQLRHCLRDRGITICRENVLFSRGKGSRSIQKRIGQVDYRGRCVQDGKISNVLRIH